MYEAFYRLSEPPFRLPPDPRYLYLSAHHRDAPGPLPFVMRDARGRARRRGAELEPDAARPASAALESRDRDREAAANRARWPTGIARHARPAGARAIEPAHHRALASRTPR